MNLPEVVGQYTEDLEISIVAQTWTNTLLTLYPNEPGLRGLLKTSEAWSVAEAYLYPRDIAGDAHPPKTAFATDDVRRAFEMLHQSNQLYLFLDRFRELMLQRQYLITRDIEAFTLEFDTNGESRLDNTRSLIDRLVVWYHAWAPDPQLNLPMAIFNSTFHTHVFSVLPPIFLTGYKLLVKHTMDPPYERAIWNNIELLGFMERYDSLIASVVQQAIEEQVKTLAKDWSERKLKGMQEWITTNLGPWMMIVYARGAKNEEEGRQMLMGVKTRFDFHLCKALCDLRTSEIFDIIVDYPDSKAALEDLKDCMIRVDQRANFVSHMRKENRRRLLHPGANTDTILYQYVSTIKCLRMVDPAGVLLFKVADPIRKYLRDRPDTIRSIVASLVGEGSDFVDENEPPAPLQLALEDFTDPNWEPEPVDAGPLYRSTKPADVLSTLVSIYDSQDLFVKELQVLLAQRLLAIMDANYDKERRNVEILKIRFGEEALQVCEVMLKDMSDSRRIDQHIQSHDASALHPTIISRQFWPALQLSELAMPGQFKKLADRYAREFSQFKPDKRLRWIPHLGTVDVQLELSDRTVEVSVSPLEAAVIEFFSTRGTWTTPDLAKETGVTDILAVGKAVATWIDIGVLKETGDQQFTLLEIADPERDARAKPSLPHGAPDSGIQSFQSQEVEQMRIYWKYIEGMLTNLNELPTDRVHNMLKLAPGFDKTVDQVGTFMEGLRREGLVVYVEGVWRLNKS